MRLIIILINSNKLSNIDFQVNMDTENDLKYGKVNIFGGILLQFEMLQPPVSIIDFNPFILITKD